MIGSDKIHWVKDRASVVSKNELTPMIKDILAAVVAGELNATAHSPRGLAQLVWLQYYLFSPEILISPLIRPIKPKLLKRRSNLFKTQLSKPVGAKDGDFGAGAEAEP
jgi:hypothetical protein